MGNRWAWTIVAGVAACGSSSTSTSSSTSSAPAVAHAPPPACPAPAALETIARAQLHAAADARVTTTCVAGVFPEAGWAVFVKLEDDHGRSFPTLVLAAGDRRVLAATRAADVERREPDEVGGVSLDAAIDLDGDGVDELIYAREAGANGKDFTWYVVAGVAAGAVTELGAIATSGYEPEATDRFGPFTCEAAVKVGPPDAAGARALAIVPGPASGTPNPEYCELHPRTLALVHGKLVAK
jgi:hypothetical protein